MGNSNSTVKNFKKIDNGFYNLEDVNIKDDTKQVCSDDYNDVEKQLMIRCPPSNTCDILKAKKAVNRTEDNCYYLAINKDKLDGEYYRGAVGKNQFEEDVLYYNYKDNDGYDASKPSYRFVEKNQFDKRVKENSKDDMMKNLYFEETLTLPEMLMLSEKEDGIKLQKIPGDWCLSMDPCPQGLECCISPSDVFPSPSYVYPSPSDVFPSPSVTFFDKNKKTIIISASVILVIILLFIFFNKRR